MKVVHLQYNESAAGKQAIRLNEAFLEIGIDSEVILLVPNSIDANKVTHLGRKGEILSRIENKIQDILTKKYDKSRGRFSYPILGTCIAKNKTVQEADVIYIHWALLGLLNFTSIKQLAKLNKPLIIFMHDMWFITGGCHYSFDCNKYTQGCGSCPMIRSEKKNDLSAKEFRKKASIYKYYNNLYFISPSKWLYNCAKQSSLTKDKLITLIPNIVDNKLYKPFDKKVAKQILNIDENDTVICFGAVSVNSPYKGWEYLRDALNIFYSSYNPEKICVMIFGSRYSQDISESIPFKCKFVGYLKDDYSINLVYNAADVFVAPSVAETFGLVVLESLNCGTPVVAFDVGGITDLIKHKENGYIAKFKDTVDLADGIDFCINSKISGKALAIFDKKITIKKHLDFILKISHNRGLNA